MSNKPFERLWKIEQIVRSERRPDMIDGTRLTIEFISGFEKFNTRPYHNYETWGQGWRITDHETNVVVEQEDLDDAIALWLQKNNELVTGTHDDSGYNA